jgi:hemerythrin-like domain-containing protein
MPDVFAPSRPDTSDMIRVHRVFRETLGRAPTMIGSVNVDDSNRVAAVATFYANILAFLHVHHEGEDELVWPKLLERCPEHAATVRLAADQHQAILGQLEAAAAQLGEWQQDPTTSRSAALTAALVTLSAGVTEHLDNEERTILPLAEAHITVEEWGQLPMHGMKNFRGDKLWLIIGLLREQMTIEQLANMDARMPPPVRQYWVEQGEPMFRQFVTELRR